MAIDDVDNLLAKRKHAGIHHVQQQVGANVTNPPGVTKIPEAAPQAACDPSKAPDSAPPTAGGSQQGDLRGDQTNAIATVADSMFNDLMDLLSNSLGLPTGAPPAANLKGVLDTKGAPPEQPEGPEKGKHAKKGGGGESGALREVDTPTEILLVDEKGNVIETLPKPPKPASEQPKVQELSGSQGAALTAIKPLSPQELAAKDPDRVKRIGGPETPR